MPLSVNNHNTNIKYNYIHQYLSKGLEHGIYLKHKYIISKENSNKPQEFAYHWCNNDENANNLHGIYVIDPDTIQILLKPNVFNEIITTELNYSRSNYSLLNHGYFNQFPTLKKNIKVDKLFALKNKTIYLLILAINSYCN